MLRPRPAVAQRRARQGYLYVAVMFSSLLIATAVAGALAVSTTQLRGSNDRASRIAVIQLAESELQIQAVRMQSSTDWRSSLSHGEFSAWRELSGGRVRHAFTDLDGELDDDLMDGVTLTVHAQLGAAEAAVAVDLSNRISPMPFLAYNATALDDLEINGSGCMATEAPVQVDDDCRANSGGMLVTPRLEFGGSVTLSLRGNDGPSDVVAPESGIIERYQSVGTRIHHGSIPKVQGHCLVQNVVLSSTHNPYGAPDPEGMYWIDGNPKDVIIRNARIEGTLVVGSGTGVRVMGGVVWNSIDPARAALIARRTIEFDNLDPVLSEAVAATNLNPPHTPDRGGVSNATQTDTYATSIGGLVYSLEDIRVAGLPSDARLRFAGTLIADDIEIAGPLSMAYVPELLTQPPPGFRDPVPMQFVRGSWRRVPTP